MKSLAPSLLAIVGATLSACSPSTPHGSQVTNVRRALDDDMVVGPEQPVGLPIDGLAESSQVFPAAARGDDGLFVVWQDERRDPGGDIFGARISNDGTLLDRYGIVISAEPGTQEFPRIASDGSGYLVVWTDWRLYRLTIFAARVSAEGEVLDPDGLVLGDGIVSDVAFNGNEYVVVWQGGGAIIKAARVSIAGELFDDPPIDLAGGPISTYAPSVTNAHGLGVLVTWSEATAGGTVLKGGLISAGLDLVPPGGTTIASHVNTGEPARAAYDEDHETFSVVWQDDASSDVHAIRLGSSATPIDTEPILIAAAPGTQGGADVDFDGTNFVIAWHEQTDPDDRYSYDIRSRRVDPAGSVVDDAPIIIADEEGQQARPVIISAEGTSWIVWDGDSVLPWDIYATSLGSDGSVSPETTVVTQAVNAQHAPRVAVNGEGQAIVWQDTRSAPDHHVFAQQLGPYGGVGDERDRQLSNDGAWTGDPSIASASSAVVAWHQYQRDDDTYTIAATGLAPDGQGIDPGGRTIRQGTDVYPFWPSLAFGDDVTLVVWEEERPDAEYSRIYGARLGADGQPLDDDILLISGTEDPESGSCDRLWRRRVSRRLGSIRHLVLRGAGRHDGCRHDLAVRRSAPHVRARKPRYQPGQGRSRRRLWRRSFPRRLGVPRAIRGMEHPRYACDLRGRGARPRGPRRHDHPAHGGAARAPRRRLRRWNVRRRLGRGRAHPRRAHPCERRRRAPRRTPRRPQQRSARTTKTRPRPGARRKHHRFL